MVWRILVNLLLAWSALSLPTSHADDKLAKRFGNSTSSLLSSIHGFNVFQGLPGTAFTENGGLDAAMEAVPVFLFARIGNAQRSCYPESGVLLGSNPPVKNPGTEDNGNKGPIGPNPGISCVSPGSYTGAYSPGNAFPVYYLSRWCENKSQWRISYSLYYPHDGAGLEGHLHDWETVIVAWTSTGDDLWQRNSAVYSFHNQEQWRTYGWGDLTTVDSDDLRYDTAGQYKAHPKAFVGMYKHGYFPDKNDQHPYYNAIDQKIEYRSDDFARLPERSDMIPGTVIGDWNAPGGIWNYGSADSNPWNINGGKNGKKDICYL